MTNDEGKQEEGEITDRTVESPIASTKDDVLTDIHGSLLKILHLCGTIDYRMVQGDDDDGQYEDNRSNDKGNT
ncbi:hypothetical protein FOZ62_004151, partial [Perkinsus olseni]